MIKIMKGDNYIECWDAVDSNRCISQPEGEHKVLFQATGWYSFCKRIGDTVFDNPFSKLWDDDEYPDPTLNENYNSRRGCVVVDGGIFSEQAPPVMTALIPL